MACTPQTSQNFHASAPHAPIADKRNLKALGKAVSRRSTVLRTKENPAHLSESESTVKNSIPQPKLIETAKKPSHAMKAGQTGFDKDKKPMNNFIKSTTNNFIYVQTVSGSKPSIQEIIPAAPSVDN